MSLYTAARVDLRLSESDFWRLTPRKLMAMLRRHNENVEAAEKRADFRAGQIWALLANAHTNASERPKTYEPSDAFPSLRFAEVVAPQESGEVDDREQQLMVLEQMKAAAAAFGHQLYVVPKSEAG